MFGYVLTKFNFEWIDYSLKWVEVTIIYVWIHLSTSELKNKFKW